MSLFKLIPLSLSTHVIRISALLVIHYWSLLILQMRDYISEKFMTIMLKNWGKFINYFLFNIVWRNYYNNLPIFLPVYLLIELLIILLKPYILVELGE